MHRLKRLWIGLILLAGAVGGFAELAVPSHSGWVVDTARMFSSADERRISGVLQQLKGVKNGAQMAVLTVPSLKGDSFELFSIRVAEKWKLGKKDMDNGLLLLISRDDRKMRLETGYGLEDRLTDARCGDIIRSMGPYFKKQRFADGVLCAIGSVQEHLTGTRPSGVPAVPRTSGKRKGPDLFFFLIVFFVFILPMIRHRRIGLGHTLFLGGGYRGGGFGGGGFSGGGFSGGGGSFGGGGASGGW